MLIVCQLNIMTINPPLQLQTPEDISRLLAERLRAQRLSLGWKQETLAKRSGISVATIRRFEHSGHSSVENLLKLCHALGRLDDFQQLLLPPIAQSLDELETRETRSVPQRGRR
jgi:transcriptional regulator with XRE-family HTH domain